ncbi:MAG: hypothetical protein JNK84_01490 [Phreatobacter sp.]|uniref:hypothetical protein n=1 Tax=Phreatobacter sp. TaxID=1966341 RepID=UPI001A6024B1|nr:hypothetical protein [Phreatobacter sp.]MBL8567736.1 hypothetical protein [Phreatobacter sp.]
MDRRSFFAIVAGGLAASAVADRTAAAGPAGNAPATLGGVRSALGTGDPVEMQRRGGGFRGGGGGFRGGGNFRPGGGFAGGYRGAWRAGGGFSGGHRGAWRGGYRGPRWRGYGGPYYGGPYYGGGFYGGPFYGYGYGYGYPYRRCWIDRWGYRVWRRPYVPAVPFVPFPFPFF